MATAEQTNPNPKIVERNFIGGGFHNLSRSAMSSAIIKGFEPTDRH